MEPVTLTATAITAVIFKEAIKEVGKNVGKGTSELVGKLLTVVREKLRAEDTEGCLTRAQNQPTELNKLRFQQELEALMIQDPKFAMILEQLLKQLNSNQPVDDGIQIVGKDIEASGNIELKNISSEAKNGFSGEQETGTNLKAGKSVKISNVKQIR